MEMLILELSKIGRKERLGKRVEAREVIKDVLKANKEYLPSLFNYKNVKIIHLYDHSSK
jgi:hypothetical protein